MVPYRRHLCRSLRDDAAGRDRGVDRAASHGTVVSYDLNYRPSLWKSRRGGAGAQKINRQARAYIDVMIGNEEDFTACLGFEVEGVDARLSTLETGSFQRMIETGSPRVSEFRRRGNDPSYRHERDRQRLVGDRLVTDTGFVEATARPGLEILDRVGGGDSFASGLIYGMLEHGDLQEAVELGAAHGALVMTTPGDTSSATLAEVEKLARGGNARVQR